MAQAAVLPPGQLIDIGTHRMHLRSLGEGTPTVVLDAGAGDNLLSWYRIQPEIARFTRVVAYDRSGMGWSERGPNPRAGETVVRELHDLLVAAQVPAPYVLVGHSMGGVHVRMFAQAYPELVAGMALVDSSHERQVSRFARAIPGYTNLMSAQLEMLRGLRGKSQAEVIALLYGAEMAPGDPELDALRRDRVRPEAIDYVLEEMDLVADILDQAEGDDYPLGDLPLRVLTATKIIAAPGLSPEEGALMLDVFQGLQRQISTRSSRSQQIFVAEAGHYIHHDQPQVVIDAIREVVEMTRQGA